MASEGSTNRFRQGTSTAPLVCRCGSHMAVRTSWSDKNPGRRYKCCPNYQRGRQGYCGVFVWLDPVIPEHVIEVINELKEKTKLTDLYKAEAAKFDERAKDASLLKTRVASLENENKKYKEKIRGLKIMKKNVDDCNAKLVGLCNAMGVVIVILVLVVMNLKM